MQLRLNYFKFIVVSSQLNYAKPDKEIFDHYLKLTNCDIKDVLYVGDDYERDFLGAKNAGWEAVMVRDFLAQNAKLKTQN